MLIVPKEIQMSQNTALAFFERTLGRVAGMAASRRLLNAFIAISSLGKKRIVCIQILLTCYRDNHCYHFYYRKR